MKKIGKHGQTGVSPVLCVRSGVQTREEIGEVNAKKYLEDLENAAKEPQKGSLEERASNRSKARTHGLLRVEIE